MVPLLRSKLHSRSGVARLIVILAAAVLILAIICLIPAYRYYQESAKNIACATALDSARRQLAAGYMLDGFQNGSAQDAKALVTHAMNGWDDLCPDGGTVYITRREDSPLDWDVYCGLHGKDSKRCTRLNADYVLQQLEEELRQAQLAGTPYPESLPFTLHHRSYTAYLVDEATGLRRGTRLTDDYEGIVAFYSIVGHSDFGADCGMEEGSLWYFSYADEEHCATWDYHDTWTGDSYRGVH